MRKAHYYPNFPRSEGWCRYNEYLATGKIIDYERIPIDYDGNYLKYALNRGPVVVGIVSNNFEFLQYKDGIYPSDPNICGDYLPTHAVLAVGYGKDYILVKNSYNTGWGIHGYMKVRMNSCGINLFAYQLVEKKTEEWMD